MRTVTRGTQPAPPSPPGTIVKIANPWAITHHLLAVLVIVGKNLVTVVELKHEFVISILVVAALIAFFSIKKRSKKSSIIEKIDD
ncbi:hypothetical protein Tco_0479311 [Tanacetum coccineum]